MTPGVDIREFLLNAALRFVQSAAGLSGVRRIELIGSLTTNKRNPKDIDLLVIVDDETDLAPLAKGTRQLLGAAQSINCGVDVFLADLQGHYLGRICLWKECRPGVRVGCDAWHCGRRRYLHDDFGTVRLSDATIAAAPAQLWPTIERRCKLPDDVEGFMTRIGALLFSEQLLGHPISSQAVPARQPNQPPSPL
jgi:hypothetical protein